MIRLLQLKNGKFRGSGRSVKKKWRAWPGQHIECGICGRLFYWGGHGTTDHMMCSGSREYCCWNGATFDGVEAGKKLAAAFLGVVDSLPGFGIGFERLVCRKAKTMQARWAPMRKKVARDLAKVASQIERVQRMILDDAKGSRTLGETLLKLEAEQDRLRGEQATLEKKVEHSDFLLPSVEKIKEAAHHVMRSLSSSPEFARQMRELVPSITVFPYRLCDGGRDRASRPHGREPRAAGAAGPPGQRARKVLRLGGRGRSLRPAAAGTVRKRVVEMRSDGDADPRRKTTEREVAKLLKLTVTATATQKAMALQRLMDEQGLADPYVPLMSPPIDCSKLRR